MNKTLIIAKGILNVKAFYLQNNTLLNLDIYDKKEYIKNSIFIGKITQINHILKAIFVDCGDNDIFLVPFSEIRKDIMNYDNNAVDTKVKKDQKIIVQIKTEKTGQKRHKATTFIDLNGFYCTLLTYDKPELQKIDNYKFNILINKNVHVNKKYTKSIIKNEYKLLCKVWEEILLKFHSTFIGKAYKHSFLQSLLTKYIDKNTHEIIINDMHIIEEVQALIGKTFKKVSKKISFLSSLEIEKQYKLHHQLKTLSGSKIQMSNGTSIVIEHSESMTTIDVNSSKYKTCNKNYILDINLKAAEEVVRQILLRNIGGLIAIDFIDNLNPLDQNKIILKIKNLLDYDKSSKISKINCHNVITISRIRLGKNIFEMQYIKKENITYKKYEFVLEEIIYELYHKISSINNIETALIYIKKIEILEFIINNYIEIHCFILDILKIKFLLNTSIDSDFNIRYLCKIPYGGMVDTVDSKPTA